MEKGMEGAKKGKSVSASLIIDQVVEVFPNDLNAHGTLFGGRVMQLIDSLAAIVAKRHSGVVCVTLGIDSVRFLSPARHGDILVCMGAGDITNLALCIVQESSKESLPSLRD